MSAIETTYREALRQALIDAMQADPEIVVMAKRSAFMAAPMA
jgi:pyruvate/2-oxoglutarate/acetoin dehydrogenase E1 component